MRLIPQVIALVCCAAATCIAQNNPTPDKQEPAVWQDPSPHSVQFVTVEKDVKLEVLDWGGTGRPVILLSGLGNTAHVFDDFAPKLTADYHVYGITRRGFGASTVPDSGYAADRLGDDVLAVLEELKLSRPVLVGHSIAGEELSSIGFRHPERVAGLVYLDAGYGYAFYDMAKGDFAIDLQDLQKKLDQLQKRPADPKPLVNELLQKDLPTFERDLQELQKNMQALPTHAPKLQNPTAADLADFPSLHAWQVRVLGLNMPESELHQTTETTPEGHVGKQRMKPAVPQAVVAGSQKYTEIKVPVLAIYAIPHDRGPAFNQIDPAAREAIDARDIAGSGAQASAFEAGVPSAHVVRLPHANHYVFLSNQADVLREMHAFINSLH